MRVVEARVPESISERNVRMAATTETFTRCMVNIGKEPNTS